MQNPLLEQLVTELVATDGIMLVMDSAGAVSEMHPREVEAPQFDRGWATIEAAGWHVHMNLAVVEGVQFVEADDRMHEGIAKLYYVRLSGGQSRHLNPFLLPQSMAGRQ